MGKEHDYRGQYEAKEFPTGLVVIPKEVKFYLLRLEDLTKTLTLIDRGCYPVTHHDGIPMGPGYIQKEDPKLEPTNYSKGLRRAMLVTRQGVRNILADMGYQKETDTYLRSQDQSNQVRQPQSQSQTEGRL